MKSVYGIGKYLFIILWHITMFNERKWVFDFLIHISLHSNVVFIWNFILLILFGHIVQDEMVTPSGCKSKGI